MSESERAGREEVWIEKYRPQTLGEVVGHETIVERLQSYVDRNDLSHMLFAGPAGTGKCVTGETPVLTNDGVARIDRLVGDVDGFEQAPSSLQVCSLADDSEFEYTHPSHVFSKPTSDGVAVETRDGNSITATPEHRFLVLTHDGLEWRCADNLEAGDRIVRPLDVPFPETDRSIDWMEALDGEKTHVHVSESFAHEHGIPLEERFVGTKKEIVRGIRNGRSNDKIAAAADTTTKYVAQVARDLSDESLDAVSTVCSLSYLKERDVSEDRLRTAVEAIQRVVPENGSRSPPIEPVWECTPELTTFLALAISEARIENGRIKFYNTDKGLLDRFEQSARTLFGLEPTRGTQHDVPFVECNTRSLTRFLECCSSTFETAMDGDPETLGSLLVNADEQSRSAFLRAFFDAEGYVSRNGFIELSQKDDRIISLLSYLLAGAGIPSRRKTEQKAASNGSGEESTYHTLSVSGASALQRFQDEIGFSVEHKRTTLATHVGKSGNPNHDTVPVQHAVNDLCDRLALTKSSFVPTSLNPASPGRAAYTDAMEAAVDAASSKLEVAQTVRAELTRIEPEVRALSQLPLQWDEQRTVLAGGETLETAADVTGISKGRIRGYAAGERTPYATRTMRLLEQTSGTEFPDVDLVQTTLHSAIERLDISYNRVAENTSMLGTDIANLLTNDDWEVSSMPRFATVADRLQAITDEMLSMATIERLSALDSLVEADLYFDEVTAVEPISDDLDVYDLTVPEHRNYVAGQVPTVMHNTTSATAIARELYGEDWQEHFLELNASDERGIDVVRDRIKSFARTSFGGVDYRIIFLDEADALTSDAQSALRRTMEQFSNNVRFIMSCNYSSQIIDPIQSRCAVFRFSPLGDEAVEEEIRHIAEAEGIELTEDGVDALVYAAGGDMRKAINGLQAASVSGDVVDEEAVFAITSTARPEVIQGMVQDAIDGDFKAARSQLDDLITDEGIAGGDIIDQLHRSIWEFDVPDEDAVRILDRVGEADYRITEGANERIQLEAMLASLSLDE